MLVGVLNKGQEDCATSLHNHGNQEREDLLGKGVLRWGTKELYAFPLCIRAKPLLHYTARLFRLGLCSPVENSSIEEKEPQVFISIFSPQRACLACTACHVSACSQLLFHLSWCKHTQSFYRQPITIHTAPYSTQDTHWPVGVCKRKKGTTTHYAAVGTQHLGMKCSFQCVSV